jgi:transcription elongation factor Elf1
MEDYMGWFSADKCGNCSVDVNKGFGCKECGKMICCNCLVNRSTSISHMIGTDTIACPACGRDMQLKYDAVVNRCRGIS